VKARRIGLREIGQCSFSILILILEQYNMTLAAKAVVLEDL
jgi:hypothetical protein